MAVKKTVQAPEPKKVSEPAPSPKPQSVESGGWVVHEDGSWRPRE